ncbi:MAG: hypothetical protein AAF471_07260, partial [Myxococcota bacterium]
MKHAIKILAGTSILCLTACGSLRFADPTLSTSEESPETTKLTTSGEIREGWGKGDEESWERGQQWSEHGVLTENSRKKLLEIVKSSNEENAKKAGDTLVQNAGSIRQEYESLSGEDDGNPAKKSAKARLQAAAADVLTVAQSGTRQKKEAAEWLAAVLFSDDAGEQKIAHNLVKSKKDLSPQLQQALADKVTEHPDHAEASQTAALLGEQTDLTDEALKGLILVGGEPGSPGQAGAVGKLRKPAIWDRIRDNYATFADTIQTALQSLKGDTAPDSANRVSMFQLATAGKTFAESIPILQEISTSTHAGVLRDVALELARHASTENAGGWIAAGNAAYNDLGNVSNAVAGGLASLVAAATPTDVTNREKLAKLAWFSRNPGVAKAILANADASKAITAVADTVPVLPAPPALTVEEKQDRVVALLREIPPVDLPTYYGNLHLLGSSIVGALARAHAPVLDAARREAVATLAWNSNNAELAKAVLADANASEAIAAAADTDAKQESLVTAVLAAVPLAAAHHGNLHEISTAIVGSLGRLHAAVNAGDITRRTNISTLVWTANNVDLTKTVLASANASKAIGIAAGADNAKQDLLVTAVLAANAAGPLAAAHHGNLHEISTAIVGALGRAHTGGNAARRTDISILAWSSNNGELAKAVLANANARTALVAAAGADDGKQDSLVRFVLRIPVIDRPGYYPHLHHLGVPLVGSLGRLHAAANAGDLTRRTNISTLVWTANNEDLTKAVLASANASEAIAAAADTDAKQESLVTAVLTAAPLAVAHHANLHHIGVAIAGALGRVHVTIAAVVGGPPLAADIGRRTNIATLVW